MSEQDGGEKKVSIGDALDAIRSGRNLPAEAKAAGPRLPAAGSFEYKRVTPGYWLDNLQEGIQRSRDQLFDRIATDPKAANGMGRRDLHASEAFFVPAGWLDEVDLTKPEPVSDPGQMVPAAAEAGEAAPTGEATPAGSTTVQAGSEATRFQSTEEMNAQALHVEEIETDGAGGETRMRINPMVREIFKKKAEGQEQ